MRRRKEIGTQINVRIATEHNWEAQSPIVLKNRSSVAVRHLLVAVNLHHPPRFGVAVGGESMRGGIWVRDLDPVQLCSVFEGEFDDG